MTWPGIEPATLLVAKWRFYQKSHCAFFFCCCLWHGIWKSLQNSIISGKPINNNNTQWWIPITGVLELQDIPTYTSHLPKKYFPMPHANYTWITLAHATSQYQTSIWTIQAKNNSADLDKMSFLKEPYDLGSTVCHFHPMIRQPNLLTILTPSIRTTHLISLPYWS